MLVKYVHKTWCLYVTRHYNNVDNLSDPQFTQAARRIIPMSFGNGSASHFDRVRDMPHYDQVPIGSLPWGQQAPYPLGGEVAASSYDFYHHRLFPKTLLLAQISTRVMLKTRWMMPWASNPSDASFLTLWRISSEPVATKAARNGPFHHHHLMWTPPPKASCALLHIHVHPHLQPPALT